jgi:outer membrane protein insertion porin family
VVPKESDYSRYEGKNIKEIRIIGANKTKEYIILRELHSSVGQPFTEKNVVHDDQSLDKLGIFSYVNIYPIEEEGEVVLVIDVKETIRYLPVVSISISDENGISIGGGLKSVNMFGRAIQFSGVALFGGATTIEFRLKDPWVTGNHLGYNAEYFHRDRDNELFSFHEISDEPALILSSYIGRHGRMRLLIGYQYITSDQPGRTLSENNKDNVLTLGYMLGTDTRDYATNPHRGWWTEFGIERAWNLDVSEAFWRGIVDVRCYVSLGGSHILGIFSFAALTTGTVDKDVAVWQQFGLGGTNSIRGWDLGSRTGKNQFINTLEYRYNIIEPKNLDIWRINIPVGLQLALFGDVGAAWNEPEEFRHEFIGGGGAGIRLLLPYVGMVRFDFGLGEPNGKLLVHIGSGTKADRQRDRVR